MRNTGVVRNLDTLGRIVLPKEMRKVLGIEEKDPIEILIEDDRIILKSMSLLIYSQAKLLNS